MRKALILIAVFVISFLITSCATFEPDDGRHYSPPTFHWEPYQPPQSSDFDLIYNSDDTVKLGR